MKKGMDYSIRLDEADEKYDNATMSAIQRLEDVGLQMAPRPMLDDGSYYDGHLPADINSYTNKELGEIYSLQCRFADWVHGLLTVAKASASNAEQKLKQAKAQIRKRQTGTVQDKEDKTVTDSRYVEANVNYIEEDTYSRFVEIRAEAASRDLRVVSRLITTKEMEISMNRRDGNIGRKKWGGGGNAFK